MNSLAIDYNKLHGLHYLDCVIKEALRNWGINFFDRTCTMDYYLTEMNFTVPKGMHIQIGGIGIMREQKYYKNPLHFDPESHFEDDSGSLYPSSFMAFGQGPRNCIGMRFAYTMVSLESVIKKIFLTKTVTCQTQARKNYSKRL